MPLTPPHTHTHPATEKAVSPYSIVIPNLSLLRSLSGGAYNNVAVLLTTLMFFGTL